MAVSSDEPISVMETAPGYKDAPKATGVYLMYDEEGTVIYVGKAVNLKLRMQLSHVVAIRRKR